MQRSQKLTSGMPPFRRLLDLTVALFVLVTAVLCPVSPALAAPSGRDLTAFIASEYPDRKTSAYDSQRLVSYLSGQLQSQGWAAEVQPYSMLVRTSAPGSQATRFVQVSGENVLAFREPPSPSDSVDLLLVAPYDVLFKESDDPAFASYSARSTGILLDLALGLGPSGGGLGLRNVAVAFVSGHYQYGVGIRAMLDELDKRGAEVSAALVIGDVSALSSLPLTVSDSTPVALAQAVCRSARRSGLRVTVLGPRSREALYRASLKAQSGVFSAESAFDNGEFKGEAAILSARGIPALTLGTPRNNLAAARMPAQPDKAQETSLALRDLLAGEGPGRLSAGLASGPTMAERVVLQVAGNAFFIPRKALQMAGAALSAAALVVLGLDSRRRKDLASLALLCGILAAFGLSHALKNVWFSGNKAHAMVLHPGSALFLYLWSAATLVMLGSLRLWRIRSRIAFLHSRYPGQPSAPAPGAPDGPSASDGGTKSWAGPWGLAATTANLAGTLSLGSEIAPPAMLAVLCMSIAVALDHAGHNGRVVWSQRFLCTASLLPLVFWAGSPFSVDGLRTYASVMGSLGIEPVSFTLSLAVLVACLVSTLRLPAPVSPRAMRFMTLAELGVLALLLAMGFLVSPLDAGRVPAQAIVSESYGSEGRFTLHATRPLGQVVLFPEPAQATASGIPPSLMNQALVENIRLGASAIPSAWVDIRLYVGPPDKGKEETRYVGEMRAKFAEKPTFYEVRFADAPFIRTVSSPFRLSNLAAILGAEGRPSQADLEVKPAVSYSITVTWWMPKGPPESVPLDITLTPGSSRVDLTGRAVYLDRSYSGATPAAGDTRFYQVTTVTGMSSLR